MSHSARALDHRRRASGLGRGARAALLATASVSALTLAACSSGAAATSTSGKSTSKTIAQVSFATQDQGIFSNKERVAPTLHDQIPAQHAVLDRACGIDEGYELVRWPPGA